MCETAASYAFDCMRMYSRRKDDMTVPVSELLGDAKARPVVASAGGRMMRLVIVRDERIDPNTSMLDAFIHWFQDIDVIRCILRKIFPTRGNVIWVTKNIRDDELAEKVIREMLDYPSVYVSAWTMSGENDISHFKGFFVIERLESILGQHRFIDMLSEQQTCRRCSSKIKELRNTTSVCARCRAEE